jgi:hypothetical protein
MNEANEAHRAASAIAALKLTQLAFAALVKKGILPTADLNTAMPPTVTHQLANKIRLFTPWSLPGPVYETLLMSLSQSTQSQGLVVNALKSVPLPEIENPPSSPTTFERSNCSPPTATAAPKRSCWLSRRTG